MSDQRLLDYVNRAINSGANEITIPAILLAEASEEAIEAIQLLCKMCGVEIVGITA